MIFLPGGCGFGPTLSCRIFPFFIAILFSTELVAHSAMFTDYFEFDDSGENAPEKRAYLSANTAKNNRVEQQCIDGFAGNYPCKNIDFQAFVSAEDLGGGKTNLNDIWGWTDPVSGKEVAIVGKTNGTAFVDISTPLQPVVLGFLPSVQQRGASIDWRDIKVYNDHAFIVADGSGNNNHGLQVFDLTQIDLNRSGQTFRETAHYRDFGIAHNIAINERTGVAYVVGSDRCSGGLYMLDISEPSSPEYLGCFSSDGYTHDAECVVYNGPDSDYQGREICAAYNEDSLTLVDVTNKQSPQLISKVDYSRAQYTHQGWFLDDSHRYIILNDELDEVRGSGGKTTSYVFDVSDLSRPFELESYEGETAAIDHNLYTKNGVIYESNYRAGLRVVRADDVTTGDLREVAYFDTIPNSDSAQFSGVWSSYIYFASGIVVASDIGQGLFVLKPDYEKIERGSEGDPDDASPGNSVDTEDPDSDPLDSVGGGGIQFYFLMLLALLSMARRRHMRAS